MYVYIIPMFFMNINISNTVVWLFQGTKYLFVWFKKYLYGLTKPLYDRLFCERPLQ